VVVRPLASPFQCSEVCRRNQTPDGYHQLKAVSPWLIGLRLVGLHGFLNFIGEPSEMLM
jgi:hypothetical protein